MFESFFKIVANQSTNFHCSYIVVFIVAFAQYVGTKHQAQFNFFAEAFVSAASSHFGSGLSFHVAVAITNAVITSKVCTSFAVSNYVEGSYCISSVGHGNFNDFSAHCFVLFNSFFNFSFDFCVNVFAKIFFGNANAQAFNVSYQSFGEVRSFYFPRSGVSKVFTTDSVKNGSSVSYVFSNSADLVHRRSISCKTKAGYTAIGRFNTNATSISSRLTEVTAGIRCQSPNSFASSNSSSSSAATGGASQIPGVMSSAIEGVVSGVANGEFCHVSFAQEYSVFFAQLFSSVCIKNGAYAVHHFGSARGNLTIDIDVVFENNRNACQGSDCFASSNFSVNFFSLSKSFFFAQGNVSINFFVNFFNASVYCIGKFNSSDFFIYEFFVQLMCCIFK